MATAIPDLPPFDPDDDPLSVVQRWKQYLRRVDTALIASNITDDKRQWAVLLHWAGEKVQSIEAQLTYDKTDGQHYKSLHKALTQHFEPTKNITFATYQFHEMKQEDGEGINAFVTHLKTQAARCEFGTGLDRRIKDQIVFRCTSRKVRQKALTEDLTLDNLIKAARAEESALRQATEIEKDSGPSTDTNNDNVFKMGRGPPGRYSSKLTHQSGDTPRKSFKPGQNSCQYCGRTPSHPRNSCPASGQTCKNCQRTGHWAICCKPEQKHLVRHTETTDHLATDETHGHTFLNHITAIRSINLRAHHPVT